MRFEYVGGVLPEETALIEKFEGELLPFLEEHGAMIGEAAMTGDADAESVILAYQRFIGGLPLLREENFNLCVAALKRFEQKMRQ